MKVVQTRGGVVETEHPFSAVVVNARAEVLFEEGPALTVPWRSSAKPFQLDGSLSLLPDELVDSLEPWELALGASSHSGEPGHLAAVAKLGEHLGLSEAALYCGDVLPFFPASHDAYLMAGGRARPYASDCSGKHSFMAAACAHLGADPDYRDAAHPVQVALLARVQRAAGGGIRGWVPDGCRVPSYVLSLRSMALAWANLGGATAAGEGNLGRIGRAMRAEPWFVGGTARIDSELMQQRPLLAKIGAGGLMCLAHPEEGWGAAVRVHSGSCDARVAAVEWLCQTWAPGLLPQDFFEARCGVADDRGNLVGRWRAQ